MTFHSMVMVNGIGDEVMAVVIVVVEITIAQMNAMMVKAKMQT